jgi:hypothetical protein
MNKHIAPTLGMKPSRLSSIALTFIAVTMVPAMVAVIAPANTASAPQESGLAAPGRYFGTDYIANPLHHPAARAAR